MYYPTNNIKTLMSHLNNKSDFEMQFVNKIHRNAVVNMGT